MKINTTYTNLAHSLEERMSNLHEAGLISYYTVYLYAGTYDETREVKVIYIDRHSVKCEIDFKGNDFDLEKVEAFNLNLDILVSELEKEAVEKMEILTNLKKRSRKSIFRRLAEKISQ